MVTLSFNPPSPDIDVMCSPEYDPVCGLAGSFGPLAAGIWTFVCPSQKVFINFSVLIGQPEIIYVDKDAKGVNDGTSWTNAFTSLQDALAKAWTGDEIRVAEGVYLPDHGIGLVQGDTFATFTLVDGVVVKGGYAGISEPDPDIRDLNQYLTILSGDLNDNDDPTIEGLDLLDDPNRVDNSQHVVTVSEAGDATVLDGFIITAGQVHAVLNSGQGAGMSCLGLDTVCTPTILNCSFLGNVADYGGGFACIHGASPTLINCVFSGNVAAAAIGGAIYNAGRPLLVNCTLSGNVCKYTVGGLYSVPVFTTTSKPVEQPNPTLINCILWRNTNESGTTDQNAQILGNAIPEVDFSCIQSWTGSIGGVGNTGQQPTFRDADGPDDVTGTLDDDLRLSPGSIGIDIGDNTALPAHIVTDRDSHLRIVNNVIDMGAYEYDGTSFFEGCGVIVWINHDILAWGCYALLADSGGYYALDDLGGFIAGDRVYVRGYLQADDACNLCPQPVLGCIHVVTITTCPNCTCCGFNPGDRVILLVDNPASGLGQAAVGLFAGTLGTVICCDNDDPIQPILVSWDKTGPMVTTMCHTAIHRQRRLHRTHAGGCLAARSPL